MSVVEGIHLGKTRARTDHFPAWLENLIIIAILLVIAHTVIDDLAIIFNWAHSTRIIVMLVGFAFDLFFTAEFIGRSVVSSRREGFVNYIRYERGWVDALSSVPLLLLVSGPAFVIYVIGAEDPEGFLGFLSVLKTAKAIRVTRILRLIRVIKLFGKIQNTESVMTGRQVGTISTIAVVALVVLMFLMEFVPGLRVGNPGEYYAARSQELTVLFGSPADERGRNQDPKMLKLLLSTSPRHRDVVHIQDKDGKKVYTSEHASELAHTSFPQAVELAGGLKVKLSHQPADEEHARVNLLFLLGILFVVGAFMFFYTAIFARQVADPVFIMDRGLRDMGYNLEVKLDAHNKQDEVFRLAGAYNVRWLPLKTQIIDYRRQKNPPEEKSVLSVTDIL